jgi:hypothetical protein
LFCSWFMDMNLSFGGGKYFPGGRGRASGPR